MDNKPVALINSITQPTTMATVKRTAKDGSRNTIPCPQSIKLYNMYMSGDLFDFKRKTYSCSKKSKKWWFRVFYFLVDMATTNSYIIYKECPEVKLTQKEYIISVAEHLMSCHSSRKRHSVQNVPSGVRLQGRHFPDKYDKKQNCRVFPERNRTTFCCRDCSAEHPVPLCPVPCFRVFHTVEKIPSKRSKSDS